MKIPQIRCISVFATLVDTLIIFFIIKKIHFTIKGIIFFRLLNSFVHGLTCL